MAAWKYKAAINIFAFLSSLYLRPILKGHSDALLAVHRYEIHQTRPQPFIKLRDWRLTLNCVEELLQQLFAVSFVGDRLGDLIKLCLDRFISADQTIVTLRILVLVEGNTGVLRHAPLHQSNHNLYFLIRF